MIKVNQTAFGVVTAIKEDGEYKFLLLLQSRKYQNWSFPKGKTEEGETDPLSIAMRELGEETGITEIEILDFPLIEEEYELVRKDKIFSRTNKYFLGIVKSKSVTVQEGEIFDYKWATYDEAFETAVFQRETRLKVLKEAKEYLDEYDSKNVVK
jgi:8-oxo-dGTP pyrophosphatase MutT (NUDIX family)